MANISKVNFNGNDLDVKDTYAREQILHKTADNYIADVAGDYTVNAGDIAMTSANATMHATADRTIDTDGNDSVHIDGASTLNVGGLRTETFAGDKTETVTGTTTERAGNRNTTVTGKLNTTAGEINTTTNSDYTINVTGTAKFKFPDKEIVINDIKRACYANVMDYGAKGDGVTDDTAAFKAALYNNGRGGTSIYVPHGHYLISESIELETVGLIGESAGQTEIIMNGPGPIIKAGSRTTIDDISLTFKASAAGAAEHEKVAISCYHHLPLQRTSLRNIHIYNVGTAIEDNTEPTFSVLFDSIEIDNFSYAAFNFTVMGSSGNLYNNIYISSPLGTAAYGFAKRGYSEGDVFNVMNIEWGTYYHPFYIDGMANATINSLHFERVALASNYEGVCYLSCSAKIQNIGFYFMRYNTPGMCLIRLGSAHVFGENPPEGFYSEKPNFVHINNLICCGLNVEKGGLAKSNDGWIFMRQSNFTDTFYVAVDNFIYQYYTAEDAGWYEKKFALDYNNLRFLSKGLLPTKGTLPTNNMVGELQTMLNPNNGLCVYFEGKWHVIDYHD